MLTLATDRIGLEYTHTDTGLPEAATCTFRIKYFMCRVEELHGAVRSLVDIARVLRDRRAQGGKII